MRRNKRFFCMVMLFAAFFIGRSGAAVYVANAEESSVTENTNSDEDSEDSGYEKVKSTLDDSVDDVFMTFFFYRSSTYRIKNVSDTFHVMASYNKQTAKKLQGVQYVYAKDKQFKNVYKKGKITLSAPENIKTSEEDAGNLGKIGPTIPNIKYGKCWVKWRVYKTYNGKKVYSEWKTQHMYMNGFTL